MSRELINLLIREALETELPRILTLLKELDRDADLSPEKTRAIRQRMQRYPDYKVYVALRGTELVGTFCLLIVDNLGHGGTPFAILDNVVVDPEHQGRGIGKMMLLKAMELARQNNCYKIMLSSGKHREHAHEFYRRSGFEPHGLSFATRLK